MKKVFLFVLSMISILIGLTVVVSAETCTEACIRQGYSTGVCKLPSLLLFGGCGADEVNIGRYDCTYLGVIPGVCCCSSLTTIISPTTTTTTVPPTTTTTVPSGCMCFCTRSGSCSEIGMCECSGCYTGACIDGTPCIRTCCKPCPNATTTTIPATTTTTTPPSGCIESIGYPGYEGIHTYCSLPNNVCQQGDTISGLLKVKYSGCPSTPNVQIDISGDGCSITTTFKAGRYYCSGPGCWYQYSWKLPQLPSGCLGKTATLTVSSEGASASKSIKLSDDPTRDERPTMPRWGSWSPSIIFPTDKVSYTAYAEDDKGLKEIRILFSNHKYVPHNWTVVKTCSVSGTNATCTYTGGPYPVGTEIWFKGNAVDIKGQEPYSWSLGRRAASKTVCSPPSETDGGKNYYVQGNCTEPRGSTCSELTRGDFCPWEGPRGYCCSILPGSYWSAINSSEDGTTVCCRRSSPKPWGPCLETRTINCKHILGEYYVEGNDCELVFYDCSINGMTCSGGKCTSTNCSCTSWQNIGCGVNPCTSNQMKQVRNCTPSGCDSEYQCISDPSCAGNVSCSINSVSITPQCSSMGCIIGDKIRVDVNYSGNCPSPAYIQIDASADNCTICDEDRSLCPPGICSINGIQVVCNSSPCTGYWTIPSIPSGCKGKTAVATQGSLLSDYMCEGGTFYDSTTASGSFKFASGVPGFSKKINLTPGWSIISSPYYTTATTNCSFSQLWSWDSEDNRWSSITNLDSMEPGKGYWIHVSSSCEIEFTGNNKVVVDDLPELYAGLNLIGIPADGLDVVNSKGCDISAVYDYSTQEKTWYKYILSEKAWYKYNQATRSYEFFKSEDNPILDAGKGYWMRVRDNCKLTSTTTTTTTTVPTSTTTPIQECVNGGTCMTTASCRSICGYGKFICKSGYCPSGCCCECI